VGVPHGQCVHAREAAYRAPIGRYRREDVAPSFLPGEAVGPAHDLHARRQPFDVPLPWTGQRLVEIVDVEDEVALRRGEQPEVGEVGIPAGLHHQTGSGCSSQIAGHRQRRAPEERERRGGHPAVVDGQQLGNPGQPLTFQQRHRIGSVGARRELRMARPWHFCPRGLSAPRPLPVLGGRSGLGGAATASRGGRLRHRRTSPASRMQPDRR
jgi:hypothetical protein